MNKFQINKIYNLEVFDYLKLVPDNSIDLIITDPSYNMKKADWDIIEKNMLLYKKQYFFLLKIKQIILLMQMI